MIKLFKTDGTLLSYAIRDMSPMMVDSIIIENKLLDGTVHVQTIGDGVRYFELTLISNENQIDMISTIQGQGGLFRLELDGKYYVCFMDAPRWKRETVRTIAKEGRLFSTNIKLQVTTDGLL